MAVSKPLTGLAGTRNTRELGGYRTVDGRKTKPGRFLRSDAPVRLTLEERERLYRYGVRLTVDLRSRMETQAAPSCLMGYRDIRYVSAPLSDQVHDRKKEEGISSDIGQMYLRLLEDSGSVLCRLFSEMAHAPERCILFHCTAGKDRTGIVAMLLLLLAGVGREDVLADYAESERHLPFWRETQELLYRQTGILAPEAVFRSKPEFMERAILHLEQAYGGAPAYLRQIGLTKEELRLLKKRLLEGADPSAQWERGDSGH